MVIISSREFRQNQKHYLDKVDDGEQIIVQRGKDKAYKLTPVSEDDLYFTSEMVERIKASYQQALDGKVTKVDPDQISGLLGL